MFKYNRKPTSPGEILREEFLKPLGISQRKLASHISCDYKVVNRIINEKAAVTPDIANRLSLAFETSAEFWLNAQMAQDLWCLRNKNRKISSILNKNPEAKKAA